MPTYGPVHRNKIATVVKATEPVEDRLVHPDQRDLLADDGPPRAPDWAKSPSRRPSRCRCSGFAVFQAFERDNNAIGFQQYLARFHGGPWRRTLQ
jgi:hypothetical protein